MSKPEKMHINTILFIFVLCYNNYIHMLNDFFFFFLHSKKYCKKKNIIQTEIVKSLSYDV